MFDYIVLNNYFQKQMLLLFQENKILNRNVEPKRNAEPHFERTEISLKRKEYISSLILELIDGRRKTITIVPFEYSCYQKIR